MTAQVQRHDEPGGIYRMNPTIGRELRDLRVMNRAADRPGLLLSVPGLLRAVGSHPKAPQMACSGSR